MNMIDEQNLRQAMERVKGYVDNIQMGGRNYALDSGTPIIKTVTNINTVGRWELLYLSSDIIPLKLGDKLTLSYDIKLIPTDGEHIPVINLGLNAAPVWESGFGWISDIKPNVLTHFVGTININTEELAAMMPTRLKLKMSSCANGYTFEIYNIKLERGNKATDWTPALEDMASQDEIADLKAYIGYTDSDIYGLEADFENNKFTRLAGAVGKNPGADFDGIRAFGGRRRCNVANDGTVFAYYGDENYQEDGFDSPSLTEIQCMVEQPKFYYKVVPLKTEKIEGTDGYHLRKARYYISDTPKPGFKVHPAFIRNGVEIDKIYLSAYEGNIHIKSPSHHLWNDEQDQVDFDTDHLCSLSGALPASGATQAFTRDNARKLAHNRGEGWGITTIQTLSATQLLFAIEYATFNSQTAIGNGVVNATSPIKTGSTSSLGNASGSVESGGVSYRGEENLWGNIWKLVDGVNIFNDTPISGYGKFYVADYDFVDDTDSAPYKDTGIRPTNTAGYISAFGYSEEFDWLFVPSDCKGNNKVPVGDYLWNDVSGWVMYSFGGGYTTIISQGGIFTNGWTGTSSMHNAKNGARLVYFPITTTAAASEEVT